MSLEIVVLDGIYACGTDLNWDSLKPLGHVTAYERTSPDQVITRAREAEVLIVNKIRLGSSELEQLPRLKLIVISATGMDNVDLKVARERGISVKNVAGYSTHSVAQHTFALILELTNRVALHDQAVKEGEWNHRAGFSFTRSIVTELNGKALGIYGFGKIGQAVARIGAAFGMKLLVVSAHADGEDYPFYQFTDLETLFSQCDIISLHAPLTPENEGIIHSGLLARMRPGALLINTARGGLIHETDLLNAFQNRRIGGAALDVFSSEPPTTNHPLFRFTNCIITPHMAWTSSESRTKLIESVARHVKEYSNREN